MEKETCTFSFCKKPAIEHVETDLLLIGGGMACCGAAFEAARWANAKKMKVTMVDKAATDRSGAGDIDRRSCAHSGLHAPVITGRQDVGEQREITDFFHRLIVVRKFQQLEIGPGHQHVSGLAGATGKEGGHGTPCRS